MYWNVDLRSSLVFLAYDFVYSLQAVDTPTCTEIRDVCISQELNIEVEVRYTPSCSHS